MPELAVDAHAPAVVRLWREGRNIGQIAESLGIDDSSVYRLVVLTGEMRRSIQEGLAKEAAQRPGGMG